MTKPWEETWAAQKDCVVEARSWHTLLIRHDDDSPDYERGRETAQLAAAAPDMARVLLDIEWDGGDGAGCPVCPSCYADKYPQHGSRAHKPDCALAAALAKAGVPLGSG